VNWNVPDLDGRSSTEASFASMFGIPVAELVATLRKVDAVMINFGKGKTVLADRGQ